MQSCFPVIGILGRPRNLKAIQTHLELYHWLTGKTNQVMLDERLEDLLPELDKSCFATIDEIGKKASLAIVVGGDGNMLGAARALSQYPIAVIGMNRGNLGFLTDLNPEDYQETLTQVLKGEYQEEERFLLEAQIMRDGNVKSRNSALNEVVLHPNKIAHMIEFEVYIDDVFAFSQRSDGLIISTPTGSTAYSLSGGGPILSPSLNTISLVPMFPHTLSSRPLVVDGDRKLRLKVSPNTRGTQEVSCDGQISLPVSPHDDIHIYQSPHSLRLIHPKDYSYYGVLRQKLGWSSKLF